MHFINTPIGLAGQAFDGQCTSYEPGHALHPIQLRKGSETSQVPAEWLGMDSPSRFRLSIEGIVRTFSNHQAQTIQDVVTIHSESKLAWAEQFRVLFLATPNGGGFAFNISRTPINDCDTYLS